MQKQELMIGIVGNGVVHTDTDTFDVDTRFRMVKEAGVFDYYDKTPPPGEIDVYLAASEKNQLPIRAGSFYYVKGRDEPLLKWHLLMAKELGSFVQNVQLITNDAQGRHLSDEDVAEFYLWAVEVGDRFGVTPCFEVHVNMWSENFGRVARVGQLVEKRGVKFNMTLDHSHVIFKIDNPSEQAVQGMREEIVAGRLELDPFKPNNVIDKWINSNYVRHAHARPAIPKNPVNVWARHPDGSFGRGIQYPFVKPEPGQWHAEWHEENLLHWKEGIRRLLIHHATHADSCLEQISLEIIPAIDYGAGAKYSLFDDSVACARWIRETWNAI